MSNKPDTYGIDINARYVGSANSRGEYVYLSAVPKDELKSRIVEKLDGLLANMLNNAEIQIQIVKD